DVDALGVYGAAVAKSVSHQPWPGRPPPRIAAAGAGMLNGIGIQNPGIDQWRTAMPPPESLPVPVWGSAVGGDAAEFALVAKGLAAAGVGAVEINLSCPNLEEGTMFALRPAASAAVVAAVRAATDLPIGAKLSPNSEDIVAVARAVVEAGADFVVLTNTVWGMGIDLETRRPLLSGEIGGYSGVPIKPIALRCVWEVAGALDVPIVGCGGVRTGEDVVEYLMAGAAAVAMGSIHFAEPRAGRRILAEADRWCAGHGVDSLSSLIGSAR
ncbi:MAG: dihydroorotate dehydrogenase, partial [Acidimicrobiia bacterium]|nr:dihydroorotate dehydrogenase [Acidimicrobiia bacterium]NNL68544.1 dihydroorotate dehydrogenase [Acidimicrobiia bacterium]